MAERLKNTLAFSLEPGASVDLVHGLMTSLFRPLAPDVIFVPSPSLDVSATTTIVTLTNTGPVALAGAILVEAWHTIERAFSDVNEEDLPVKPYIVVSAESANQPPIPPFALTQTIIYANQTGSDDTGKGTQLLPYRTFQRAVRDIPPFIPPGARYVIDITNLGDETLPEGYELPAWAASDFIFPFPDNAVTIRADMKPAAILAPSARVFTPTSKLQNPLSKTWTVGDASQAWPDLKGFYLQWGDPDDPLIGVIHENTGVALQFTGDETPFDEMRIVEPSARLIGNWQIHCTASLLIVGVKFDEANPFEGSITISDCETWMERCTIVGPFFAAPVYRHYTFNCDLVRPAWNGQFYCSGCRVTDFEFEAFEAPPYMIFKSGTVFENIGTIAPVNLDPALRFATNLLVSGILIKSCLGDGFFLPGGTAVINDADVNNCQGNAFHFKGPGKYILANVGGSGSTGVGVRVDDGAVVQTTTKQGTGTSLTVVVDPDAGPVVVLNNPGAGFTGGGTITIAGATSPANNGTFGMFVLDADNVVIFNPNGVTEAFPGTWLIDPVTVTGANAQQVGDLAAGAYPASPFNIVDVYGGVNPNITGTGSRLYNK